MKHLHKAKPINNMAVYYTIVVVWTVVLIWWAHEAITSVIS